MTSRNSYLPPLNRLKQRAKQLKKTANISQAEAYSQISKHYGYPTWNAMLSSLRAAEDVKQNIPSPSINFTGDDDVNMTEEGYEALGGERTAEQKILLSQNKRELAKLGLEFSVFELTATGLKKSIIDATQTVRTHFELENFHFYYKQDQGPEHKKKKTAFLLTDEISLESSASFYRPKTKKGDPRMWFSKLAKTCDAGDQVAIIIHKDCPYLINLSKTILADSLRAKDSRIGLFLNKICEDELSIAEELLSKLKHLAKAPLPALKAGSTGIGFTIEAALGIAANSSKAPDYHGIEIKAGRGVKSRTTLFAQVPDWTRSPCKKSAEILNKYGYERDGNFKLYCTLSTLRENSQGLSFIYDEIKDELQEWHEKQNLVAVWPGDLLRKRLGEKHAETFWIEASTKIINGVEHFWLTSVTHTKRPILSQLLPLIQSGIVTMDHLIKRNGKTNRVSEKGPLFKINKKDLELLFPKPKTYSLFERE